MDKILTILFFIVCQGFYSQIQIVSPTIKEKSNLFLCVRIVPLTDAGSTLFLYMQPINNTDSLGFNELLNDFKNRIIYSFDIPIIYDQFTKKNEPIKVDNDSSFMINSLFAYPDNQKLFFHSLMFDVYVFFVKANVEYRIVKNITKTSYLKFNFHDNSTSTEFIELPKFYEMKILTGFVWKD